MDYALIVRWGAPVIGIMALVYVFAVSMRSGVGAGGNGNRQFRQPIVISLIIAAIASYFIISKAPDVTPWAIFIGWGLMMVLFITQSFINRKFNSQTGTDNLYKITLTSVFTASAIAILGVSAGPYVKKTISVSVEDTFIVIAAGFWLSAFFYSLPAALYDKTHNDENAVDGSSPGLIFRSISTEILFLIVIAIATCIALAVYRFEDKNLFGLLYPLASFSASLFFALLMVPILKPCSNESKGSAKVIRCILGVILYIAGTGLVAYYLAVHALLDIRAFYCFGVGLISAIIITALNGLSNRSGSIFKKELAVIEILMALGATVLSFRWMTGYGAALCSIGFLASLPIIVQINLQKNHKSDDAPLPIKDAVKYMEPVTAVSSYLILIAILRLFAERMGISRSGIDIAEPYSLIGLTIGGIFPLLMGTILKPASNGAMSADAVKMPAFGRQTAFRTLGIFILVILIPLLIAAFWRDNAAGGFIAGLAISELFLIVQFRLREATGKSDGEGMYVPGVNHLIAVGSALILMWLTPSLLDMTAYLTRSEKIIGLGILMGALLIVFVIIIGRKLYAIRHI